MSRLLRSQPPHHPAAAVFPGEPVPTGWTLVSEPSRSPLRKCVGEFYARAPHGRKGFTRTFFGYFWFRRVVPRIGAGSPQPAGRFSTDFSTGLWMLRTASCFSHRRSRPNFLGESRTSRVKLRPGGA